MLFKMIYYKFNYYNYILYTLYDYRAKFSPNIILSFAHILTHTLIRNLIRTIFCPFNVLYCSHTFSSNFSVHFPNIFHINYTYITLILTQDVNSYCKYFNFVICLGINPSSRNTCRSY